MGRRYGASRKIGDRLLLFPIFFHAIISAAPLHRGALHGTVKCRSAPEFSSVDQTQSGVRLCGTRSRERQSQPGRRRAIEYFLTVAPRDAVLLFSIIARARVRLFFPSVRSGRWWKMSRDSGRRAFIVYVLTVASLLPALLGAGPDIAEYTKTLTTQDAKCYTDRHGNHVDAPAVKSFAYPPDGRPCIMTMMGTQVKIDYVNTDEKDMTTFINIPTNAVISGSCKSPQWISLSWNGQGGLSRTLTIKANPNVTTLQEDDVQKYSVEQVSLRVEIDNETFPGIHHNVQTIIASLDNQQLFETPFNKSFNCKEIILNLHTNDPVGPIAITFEDIQFQAYTDKSTFSEGVNCKSTESTDYVAIGIGVFLAATIISALASYVFCQWWRKKDRGV